MNTVVALPTISEKLGGFYVPRFELRIAGALPPNSVLRDVLELTYKDSLKEIDSIELTVNNWDPSTADFKYTGATTEAGRSDASASFRTGLFEPCRNVFELRIGYGSAMTLMMNGNFTSMEPSFSASGASTLAIRGLNALHQLRRKPYTHYWENMKDSAVARNIATLNDGGKKRFPFPIETNSTALATEPELEYLAQENQHDIDFLLYRARIRGYVVVLNEPSKLNPKKHVYFGPTDTKQNVETYALEWGTSLIDFKPTLTTANQVKSVTVNGWDRHGKKKITGTCDVNKLSENSDLNYLLVEQCDQREEIVVNRPVSTTAEAERMACDLLQSRHREMVKASGTTIGLPELRSGRRVEINGLGDRFSGTYFVTETTHTLNDSGYVTRFKARRESENSFEERQQ